MILDMLSAFEVFQDSSIERVHKSSTNSASASFLSELLNLFCQLEQVCSQSKSLENGLETETSTATDATSIELDNTKAGYTPTCQNRSELTKNTITLQVNDDSPNSPDAKKTNEPDERQIDLARHVALAKDAELKSDGAIASKEIFSDEPSHPTLASQLKQDKEAIVQISAHLSEKLLIESFNFKANKMEPAIQNGPTRVSEERNSLAIANPTPVKMEDIEVLSENEALKHLQASRLVKENFKDSGQPTLLNHLFETEENSKSSSVRADAENSPDVLILKSISNAQEKTTPKPLNAPPLNSENLKQFAPKRGLSEQKNVNPHLFKINKNLDILTPALMKSETLITQTVADKGDQNILRAVELVEGIKEKIMLMVREQDERAIFKLNPPELGRLEIRLELHDKSCRAEILVQNPAVKALIETHAGELARGLQNANLELTNLFVSLESNGNKRESENKDAQFWADEKIKEVNPAKKQTASVQRVNKLSDTSVDIVV